MKEIFEEIARKEQITVEEAIKEMQIAINAAFENPTPAALSIPRKGKIPTPQEFVEYVANIVADN